MKPKETGYTEDDQGKDYVESVLHTSSSHNPFLCHLGTTSKSTENYAPLIIMPIKIKTSEHRSSYHMPRPNLIRSCHRDRTNGEEEVPHRQKNLKDLKVFEPKPHPKKTQKQTDTT